MHDIWLVLLANNSMHVRLYAMKDLWQCIMGVYGEYDSIHVTCHVLNDVVKCIHSVLVFIPTHVRLCVVNDLRQCNIYKTFVLSSALDALFFLTNCRPVCF